MHSLGDCLYQELSLTAFPSPFNRRDVIAYSTPSTPRTHDTAAQFFIAAIDIQIVTKNVS
jgi:hypothetical protein